MNRKIITISQNEIVSIPGETKMSIAEIADLFDIYYREAKRHIRDIEKQGIAGGDNSMGGYSKRLFPKRTGKRLR